MKENFHKDVPSYPSRLRVEKHLQNLDFIMSMGIYNPSPRLPVPHPAAFTPKLSPFETQILRLLQSFPRIPLQFRF